MLVVKDNHLLLSKASTISELIQKTRKKTSKKIVVEVDTLKQLTEALSAQPDVILLDNMRVDQLKKAVRLRNKQKGKKVLLEASGGVNLKTIQKMARTGVDRISIGSITHSPASIDVSMEILV